MGPVLTPAIDALPDAMDRLIAAFDPIRIVMFGSHARGDARPDSDLDLLVVVPRMPDKRELAAAMLRSLRGIPANIEVIPTDPAEIARRGDMPGDVLRAALREGRTVYERSR
ncbi:MAG: nucleotidyltransferase domain-containing protein [Actinobacteria bacterium HGW-Actinobacteria-10]|jgi:predicted nucleotidyltransferase|nr:MAG: nucleotidyltransferase domain-containing protein [Actinobacteria bacterium HGW-Actinobacteria-10]